MRRRQWLVVGAGVVVVGAVTALVVWRPWATPEASSALNVPTADGKANFQPPDINLGALLDPAQMVTLVCVNKAGDPCKVTVTGGAGSVHGSMSAELAAAPSRSPSMRVSGPYTIEAITVERGEKSRRQVLNVTVPAGQTREVRVNADDTVEVARASR